MPDQPLISNDASEQAMHSDSPSEAFGKLKDQLVDSSTQVRTAAVDTAKSVKAGLEQQARETKEEALRKAKRLQSAAEEQWSRGCESAKQLQSDAESYIRSNPTKAVLGGFAVGLLIGLLTRR